MRSSGDQGLTQLPALSAHSVPDYPPHCLLTVTGVPNKPRTLATFRLPGPDTASRTV
jgi:hypothetical protein